MSTIIEHHAQKAAIVEDMLRGASIASLESKYGLHRSTLRRFRDSRVKPAIASVNPALVAQAQPVARSEKNVLLPSEVVSYMNDKRAEQIGLSRLTIAAQFAGKIASYDNRADKMLGVTENKEDSRGFAAVHGSILKSVELQARLMGALSTEQHVTQTNIAITLHDNYADAPADAGEIIDTSAIDMDQAGDGTS